MNVLETIRENDLLPQVREDAELPENAREEEEEKIVTFPVLRKIREKLHIKPFPKNFINAKSGLIAACLALIAVAGYLNVRYGITQKEPVKETPPVDVTEPVEEENYFASAVIDRERVRDEAMEVLVSITNDESAETSVRDAAFEQMERLANETSWEVDIENLIKAKGFDECIAVINGDSANIVVRSDGLTPGEIAQIKEIVYLESENEIVPKNIKIIEKN